jgi:hypothetical protein
VVLNKLAMEEKVDHVAIKDYLKVKYTHLGIKS